MNPRIAGPVAVLLTSSVLLAGCGGDDEPAQPTSTRSATATTTASPDAGVTPPTAGRLQADTFLAAVSDALREAGSFRATLTVSGGLTRDFTIADAGQVADGLRTLGTPERFTYVGAEQVDGTAADHYRVGIDLAGVLGSVELPASIRALVPDSLDADVWLDADDRPLRLTAEPAVGDTTASIELTLSDFGVSAP